MDSTFITSKYFPGSPKCLDQSLVGRPNYVREYAVDRGAIPHAKDEAPSAPAIIKSTASILARTGLAENVDVSVQTMFAAF